MIQARDAHRNRLRVINTPSDAVSLPDPERVAAVVHGLTTPPIEDDVKDYLRYLYSQEDYVFVQDIAAALGTTREAVSGITQKLSARMRRAMPEKDKAVFTRTVNLLVQIDYEEGTNKSSHRLTISGREAVKQVLGLA